MRYWQKKKKCGRQNDMISKQDVQHIAELARIKLTGKELKKFQKDLSSILGYFNILNKVNVSKKEPTYHTAGKYFREDKAGPEMEQVADKLIEAAPQKKGRYIKVKSVLNNVDYNSNS